MLAIRLRHTFNVRGVRSFMMSHNKVFVISRVVLNSSCVRDWRLHKKGSNSIQISLITLWSVSSYNRNCLKCHGDEKTTSEMHIGPHWLLLRCEEDTHSQSDKDF